MSFELLPLDCPSCGSHVRAAGGDVVYYCVSCRNGYQLSTPENSGAITEFGLQAENSAEESSGAVTEFGLQPAPTADREEFGNCTRILEPVEVVFVAAAGVAAERYLPFWILPARVEILQRRGSHGGFGGLMSAFASAIGGSETAGQAESAFVIPAFAAPLDGVVELARRYTLGFPSLGEKLGERLTGGRYGVEDARKLAHFALIATEVDKPGVLRELDYKIEFGPARLLGVPFVRAGEGWKDGLYAVAVPAVEE